MNDQLQTIENPIDQWLASEEPFPSLAEVTQALAGLSDIRYAELRYQVMERIKKQYHLGAKTIDNLVLKKKNELVEKKLAGEAPVIEDVQPWDEPVDGNALIADLLAAFRRFVYFPKEQEAFACVLWCIATYVHEEFDIFPYLVVTSPTAECGKTTLLDLVKRVIFRPMSTTNISTASIFRIVDELRPLSLIIDECDTFLNENKEAIGILNSGHDKSSGFVIRLSSKETGFKPLRFRTYGPKALGMIGHLTKDKGTILSRSIVVHLLRKKPEDNIEDFDRHAHDELFSVLRRKIARWTKDNLHLFTSCDVRASGLSNRHKDNWKPLLSVATLIGSSSLETALLAAQGKDEDKARIDRDEASLMLRDCLNIFYTLNVDRIPRDTLLVNLLRQKDSPWSRWKDRQEMNAYEMITFLRDALDIKIGNHKFFQDAQQKFFPSAKFRPQAKGYTFEQFREVAERLLPNHIYEDADVIGANENRLRVK